MTTWLISDPHFGHRNVIEYERRPFLDTEEMDNVLIHNYHSTIGENDLVFWLGDMFFCNTQRMEYITRRLHKGRNIVIRGNHDRGVSNSKFMRLGFMPHRMYVFNDYLLTHEPVSEQNMSILSLHGISKNIHGHTHSTNTYLDPTKYQCVSVECIDYKPIKFTDVARRFNNGTAWITWAEQKSRRLESGE